ncbi:uncharacterized protein DSM5745_02335 [Aspergillus mulundensis]|uniref:Uncharacterized protein n=1 Tax=Aspergillus mulundensis TaxID=1810919 RepID=A0A3D8SW87_9EURO|nr:hypothetical protein DSM5745_02335 [Aspergillus mulundensis]RDW90560.1 hypothetical protein DSM5745_02335 [Aspergillus mulundensis]
MASLPPGTPRAPRKRRIRTQTHTLPFPDHAGNPALLVFRNLVSCPLPPLYAFAIYFTHGDASPDNVDVAGFFSAIDSMHEPLDIRLELFFLRNASVEECVEHYRAEKDSRGDYRVQIAALEIRESSIPSRPLGEEAGADTSRVGPPGFVPSYIDYHRTYHGMLYVCPEKDWNTGRQEICHVLFDPFSAEEWAEWRSQSEPEVQPPMHLRWLPIASAPDSSSNPLVDVAQEMHLVSNLQRMNVTTEPWQQAMERGWTRW